MKKLSITLVLTLLFTLLFGTVAEAKTAKGYTTKKGTYVAPYHKTNPDKSKYNNYSHKGNINPYTGKKGYKK